MNLTEISQGIGLICGGVLAGAAPQLLQLRRQHSTDSRNRARDNAEESIFNTALVETREDRDNWRKTAEEAWKDLHAMRIANADMRASISMLTARVKHMEKIVRRDPTLEQYMPSSLADFDPLKGQ